MSDPDGNDFGNDFGDDDSPSTDIAVPGGSDVDTIDDPDDNGEPGGDLALPQGTDVEEDDVVDGEIIDEAEDDDIIDAEEVPESKLAEPAAPADPQTKPDEPKQRPTDGARPSGGSGGGPAGSGKQKRRRIGITGNGAGGAKYHFSLFGGFFTGAGSGNSLIRTSTNIGNGNKGIDMSPRGRRPRAGKRR